MAERMGNKKTGALAETNPIKETIYNPPSVIIVCLIKMPTRRQSGKVHSKSGARKRRRGSPFPVNRFPNVRNPR